MAHVSVIIVIKSSQLQVYIGNNVCGTLADMKRKAEPNRIRCEEEALNRGRIVKIEQMSYYMILCEVQVLGE